MQTALPAIAPSRIASTPAEDHPIHRLLEAVDGGAAPPAGGGHALRHPAGVSPAGARPVRGRRAAPTAPGVPLAGDVGARRPGGGAGRGGLAAGWRWSADSRRWPKR